MKITLGFGRGTQEVEIPEGRVQAVLLPNPVPHEQEGAAEVERALDAPIGTPRLEELARGRHKVAVVTSDMTRPMPSAVALPPVLDRLRSAGVRDEEITIVIAVGSHRPMTEEELDRLLGEDIRARYRVVNSIREDMVRLGVTAMGTPVDIARSVAEADLRVCLGNVEYHYFAGYSGGAKAIMPGCSTPAAIQNNHRRMVEEAARAGHLAGNPVREDIEEAGALVGIDFLLNVVLDEHKKIIHAAAGHWQQAHREACAFLDRLYAAPIAARADIVLVSQGGAPKDLNLYQTQKALDNAKHAVKDGGVIVLVGSCREGLGQKTFEEWITAARTPEELVERIRGDFQLGGHKAAAIALVLQRARVFLVSEMDEELVRTAFLEPYRDAQTAMDEALRLKGPEASVIVMPYGGSTLPVLK